MTLEVDYKKNMKEAYEYFSNYLIEIRDDISYEQYVEMMDIIEKLNINGE